MASITETAEERPPNPAGSGRWRGAVQVIGELMMTAGLIVLLFVFYAVYVTDWLNARDQQAETDQLRKQWEHGSQHQPPGQPLVEPPPPAHGAGFAQLYLPTLGPDLHFTVLEGTDIKTLRGGPGHYVGTQWPGQPGNFAVAGHRIGRGAPFNDLDKLDSCAPIVVETATHWYVYRVLPMPNEEANWNGHNGDPRCQGVRPMTGVYRPVVGRSIVLPSQAEVIDPVPGQPIPADQLPPQASRLITLTTCHPEFSNTQRMIIHGVLTTEYPKVAGRPDLRPAELEEH